MSLLYRNNNLVGRSFRELDKACARIVGNQEANAFNRMSTTRAWTDSCVVIKSKYVFKPVAGTSRFLSTSVKTTGDGKNVIPDYGYHNKDPRFFNQKPTLEYAKSMPSDYSAMRHEQILHLCAEGTFPARREALIRNVMAVDSVEYDDAVKIVEKIAKDNRSHMGLHHLPYNIGMAASLTGGIISFPLIFHLPTVQHFNEFYVTADVPEPQDLQTWLEVGSWSWAWMEPVIGQISFALLVAQFFRNQAINLGFKPYGNYMKSLRSRRLVKLYPQYNPFFVKMFSESDTYYK